MAWVGVWPRTEQIAKKNKNNNNPLSLLRSALLPTVLEPNPQGRFNNTLFILRGEAIGVLALPLEGEGACKGAARYQGRYTVKEEIEGAGDAQDHGVVQVSTVYPRYNGSAIFLSNPSGIAGFRNREIL